MAMATGQGEGEHLGAPGDRSAATPRWFGDPAAPALGWLHLPVGGAARGGVLLCQPLGYEYVCAHRTFRRLAEALAGSGFAVLRFDLPGTADAGDVGGGDWVPAWRSAVEAGVELLATTVEGPLVAVGMRVGALLAAAVADRLAGLVLWDPVASGGRYLREASALQAVALGASDGGDVEITGMVLPAATAASLAELALPEQVACPVLALLRPDRPAASLQRRVGRWAEAEVGEALDQGALLDGESSTALVPVAVLERITAWVGRHAGPPSPVRATPGAAAAAVSGPAGTVHERVVRLGPDRLVGVLTSPPGGSAAGRLVVCLTNAADVHIGPGRAWVTWGRTLAAEGWTVLRLDTPGVGESPTPPGGTEDRSYPVGAAAALIAAVRDLDGPGGPPAAVLGLCSGGWLAVPVAEALQASAAVAINVSWHTPGRLRPLISPADPYPAELASRDRRRVRHRAAGLVPAPVGRVLAAVGLVPEAGRALLSAHRSGVAVLLVYGRREFGLFRLRLSLRWLLADLGRGGGGVLVVDGLDHAMLRAAPRAAVFDAVRARLAGWGAG